MKSRSVTISHEYDRDGDERVLVAVQSGAFSGAGSAWAGKEILAAFARALERYPIERTKPPTLEIGFLSRTQPRIVEQRHIFISILPIDSRGSLLASVLIQTPSYTSPDVDLQHCVSVRFLTGYAEVGNFCDHLKAVLAGTAAKAVLLGS
jgi:hypothetical protein